jgi:glyoxylase-like metal-dependent hydrolase (beta-lactamase superfamily II)
MSGAGDDEVLALEDLQLGPHCTALLGANQGKYPDANAILVRGRDRCALIEPTLGVRERLLDGQLQPLGPADLILLSHCHEDHVPALSELGSTPCWVHEMDRVGMDGIEPFLDLYGLPEPQRQQFRETCLDKFFYTPRPDAQSFQGGQVWDLGGVTIEALHAPGHTAGHCIFRIEPDRVIYLGDVDLSTFGPYYGDRGSSVDDFERTCELALTLEARWYVTGHHKGAIEGRDRFLALAEPYASVIPRRENRLLEHLRTPRTLEEIVAHRLIYRPHDTGLFVDPVERRSAQLHLERLLRSGRVQRSERAGAEHFVASGS